MQGGSFLLGINLSSILLHMDTSTHHTPAYSHLLASCRIFLLMFAVLVEREEPHAVQLFFFFLSLFHIVGNDKKRKSINNELKEKEFPEQMKVKPMKSWVILASVAVL